MQPYGVVFAGAIGFPERKLVSAASTTTVEIPAVYENRTYQKLVSPSSSKTVEVPAGMLPERIKN